MDAYFNRSLGNKFYFPPIYREAEDVVKLKVKSNNQKYLHLGYTVGIDVNTVITLTMHQNYEGTARPCKSICHMP